MCQIDRRHFMAAMFTAPWLLPRAAWAQEAESAESGPTLDLHVHLVGNGDTGSGCLSPPAITGKWWFGLLVRKLGIHRRARSFDEGYVQALAETIARAWTRPSSGPGRGVRLPRPARLGQNRGLCPQRLSFSRWSAGSQRMVPCIGLNPDRGGHRGDGTLSPERGPAVEKTDPPVHGWIPATRSSSASSAAAS